jgi:hypothetical protein
MIDMKPKKKKSRKISKLINMGEKRASDENLEENKQKGSGDKIL